MAVDDVADDLPVGASISGGIDGFAHALHPAFAVGEGAVLLGEAGGRQNDVCQLGGFGHEDFLDHQEVELLQAFDDLGLVGLAPDRVFAEGVEGLRAHLRRPFSMKSVTRPPLLVGISTPQAVPNFSRMASSATF